MWLLWFSSYSNSVDFLGLYKTEYEAQLAKAEEETIPLYQRHGIFKISRVEVYQK